MTRRRQAGLASALLIGAAAVVGLVAFNNNQTVADPTDCDSYPEQRVFMENQSWVEPQPGPPGHPGTGQQGHIHISTCFPLNQTVTTDTLSLDIRVQLHNVPGDPLYIDVRAYNINKPNNVVVPFTEPCPVADCEQWVHVEFPLSTLSESGWTEFHMNLHVINTDGLRWYNITRWFFNNANGAPPVGQAQVRIGGDTWLHNPGGTNYGEVRIKIEDFPWDFTTGQMIPISGVWEPDVFFTRAGPNRVMIDPALHAVPPVFNTIYEEMGTGWRTLSIDTTQLSDGVHRLLLSSCNATLNGFDNCGVLVVRFLVQNGTSTTTTSTTTTSTTTTTIPPTVIDLDPGENLVVNCPTQLTGTIDPQIANLVCEP